MSERKRGNKNHVRDCSGRRRNKDLKAQEKTTKCYEDDQFKNRIRNSIFIHEKYIQIYDVCIM